MPYSRSGKCIWSRNKYSGKWFKLKCSKTIRGAKAMLARFKKKHH